MSTPEATPQASAPADENTAAHDAEMAAEVAKQVAAIAKPVASKSKRHIPYWALTKDALKAGMVTRGYRLNKEGPNKAAAGATVWLRWDNRRFKRALKRIHDALPAGSPEAIKFKEVLDTKYNLADDRLAIKFPFLRMPWGMSEFNNKESIKFAFDGQDDSCEAFETWAEEVFDTFMVETIAENSKNWLGQVQSVEFVKAAYRGLRIYGEKEKEGDYDALTPGVRVAPQWTPKLSARHGKGRPIDVNKDNIRAGDYGCALVQFGTIWINKPACGLGLTLQEIDIRVRSEMDNDGFAVDLDLPAVPGPLPAKKTDEDEQQG